MSDPKPDLENMTNDSDAGSPPVPEPSVGEASATLTSPEAAVTFQGNNYDLLSIVAVTVGGLVLLSCVTFNLIWYCFPVIAVILGAIGLAMAKESVNPERTRLLSWISLGSGAAILVLIVLAILAYIGVIVFAIAADSGGF